MVLVVILYLLDIFYQNWLYGSVLRTQFLEIFRLRRGLGRYISGIHEKANMGMLLHLLYAGFLVSLLVLGIFAANIHTIESKAQLNIAIYSPPSIILFFSFLFSLAGMLSIFMVCDYRRRKIVRDIREIYRKGEEEISWMRDNNTYKIEVKVRSIEERVFRKYWI